jgi:alkylation response protein AidB-like acyl-CoA dehydrogenase
MEAANIMAHKPSAAVRDAAGPLERIQCIAGLIEQSGARNETLGRLSPEVVDGLHDQRLLRLLLPKVYDGDEVDLGTWFRAMEALAKLDASTAWCVGQINGCAATASAVAPSVARTIWSDRRAALSWGPPVEARADTVEGGHELSGEWMMSSGSRHATWLGLMAPIFEKGPPARKAEGGEIRTFLVPASAVEWVDNWNVHGLIATNSGGYKVRSLFVPDGYSVDRLQVLTTMLEPSTAPPPPLYKFPLNTFFAIGFSAVSLGIARAMLDASVALAREKKPRMAKLALLDNHVVQLQIGEAEARLRSARSYVETTAERVWQEVASSRELKVAQRIDVRMATTFAIHEAKAVADAAWEVAGASAIYDGGRFERRMRDLHTLTQQLQGRKSHLQETGAYLLGLAPSLLFA